MIQVGVMGVSEGERQGGEEKKNFNVRKLSKFVGKH